MRFMLANKSLNVNIVGFLAAHWLHSGVSVSGWFEWPAIVPHRVGWSKHYFGWSDRPPRSTIASCPIMMRTFLYLKVVDLRLAVQLPPITILSASKVKGAAVRTQIHSVEWRGQDRFVVQVRNNYLKIMQKINVS